MSVENPEKESSGMTEFERRMLALQEKDAIRKGTRGKVFFAYLLWFFLGELMVHRMYAGLFKSAFIWLVIGVLGGIMIIAAIAGGAQPLIFLGVPLAFAFGVRWIVDAFILPRLVRDKYILTAGKEGWK